MSIEKTLLIGLAIAVMVALGSYVLSSIEGVESATSTFGDATSDVAGSGGSGFSGF